MSMMRTASWPAAACTPAGVSRGSAAWAVPKAVQARPSASSGAARRRAGEKVLVMMAGAGHGRPAEQATGVQLSRLQHLYTKTLMHSAHEAGLYGAAQKMQNGLSAVRPRPWRAPGWRPVRPAARSEEHTSELQSPCNLVC